MNPELPEIRFALPLASENRWSDLLAVLIQSDPAPVCRLLGLDADPMTIKVEREASVDKRNRPDLILRVGDRPVAVVEVKVLAGLGYRQLGRYESAEPNAEVYAILFPERLVVDVHASPRWKPVTWESLIGAYCESANEWVRTLAIAWRRHLDLSLPKVGRSTVWNQLTHGEDFVVAMRARMSWLFSELHPPVPIEHDLVGSSAGVSWVLRMFTDARVPGYQVMVEVEERLGVRDFPKFAGTTTHAPIGPSALVVLHQRGVTTSADFDWDYLLAMWPLMKAARSDWVLASPRPKHHDRSNYLAMVAKGGPKHLGVGFGEAQTKITGACMFGARIQLSPDITLGELAQACRSLCGLLLDMALVEAPPGPSSNGLSG